MRRPRACHELVARHVFASALVSVAFCGAALARDTPGNLTIRLWAKAEDHRLNLLVRVPLSALNEINFPKHDSTGSLSVAQTEAILPSAARWWIVENLDLYESDVRLPKPQIAETRLSLASDSSFESYPSAWEHMAAPKPPPETQFFESEAMLDVLLIYSVESARSDFGIHSRLATLGSDVTQQVGFLSKNGISQFEYKDDPGFFSFSPARTEALQRFGAQGFLHFLSTTDYLLFAMGTVLLLYRSTTELTRFALAFSLASLATLAACAYGLAPEVLWFQPLISCLLALSIFNLAFLIITNSMFSVRFIVLAIACGMIFGCAFSFALKPALQFGGAHRFASLASFAAGIQVTQVCVIFAFAALMRPLLSRLTTSGRVETIVLAILTADVAWHRLTDRIDKLTQFAFRLPTIEQVVQATGLRWVMTFLLTSGLLFIVLAVRHLFRKDGHAGSGEMKVGPT